MNSESKKKNNSWPKVLIKIKYYHVLSVHRCWKVLDQVCIEIGLYRLFFIFYVRSIGYNDVK